MQFGNFKGRARETERIIALLKAKQFCGDVHIPFLQTQYSVNVPFHNQVHVGYGLLFLNRECPNRSLFELYLAHDAGHNGNSAESPEEKSVEICKREFTSLMHPETILDTKFPYKKTASYCMHGGELRNLDTLRPASGILADPKINGNVDSTPFQAFLFECGLLFLELDKPPLEWLEKGQLGFFFPQIRLSLTNGWFDSLFSLFKEMMVLAWENELKLTQLMAGKEGQEKLSDAINFLMNDVTLPEFVAYANGIGLK